MNIQFIIEASEKSGLGRVRRSIALAAALQKEGAAVQIVAPFSQTACRMILAYKIPMMQTVSPSSEMTIVDAGPEYQLSLYDKLPQQMKLVVIDDIANCRLMPDIIINPNIYAQQLDYSYLGNPRLLGGPKYHLVEKEFFAVGSEKKDIDILISFGGSAVEEYIQQIAIALEPYSQDYSIRIASPKALRPTLTRSLQTEINQEMSALLKRSKVYLGGAGATVLEALAANCQLVVTRVAEDQKMNTLALRAQEISVCDLFDPSILTEMAIDAINNPRHYSIKLINSAIYRTARALLS
ncbi:hypothetical protein QGN29_08240 [Temperatibacter marinus]|uniref:Glycosyl transferase family 28 C-terminal domain-containing protein n=1 Tax=Temperatibacter marinus TaxID=1456591 RepID=A0AA52EA66_9PROT|nr:hypothetical protein [Temperatibacter marinus]WND01547.1 hypothetical protein QGN29_08240 [Temperatibacter marinus]